MLEGILMLAFIVVAAALVQLVCLYVVAVLFHEVYHLLFNNDYKDNRCRFCRWL